MAALQIEGLGVRNQLGWSVPLVEPSLGLGLTTYLINWDFTSLVSTHPKAPFSSQGRSKGS